MEEMLLVVPAKIIPAEQVLVVEVVEMIPGVDELRMSSNVNQNGSQLPVLLVVSSSILEEQRFFSTAGAATGG